MKKLTLFASLLGICASASAQRINNAPRYSFDKLSNASIQHNTLSNSTHNNARTAGLSAFYSQDFSGGIPGTWTTTNVGGQNWRISHYGLKGTYGNTQFKSSTASNGFIIFDYDSMNTASGLPADTSHPRTATITTGSIDCSAHPSVVLTFQQYFRYFTSTSLAVQVSGDGGVTWTSFNPKGTVAVNGAPANATTTVFNISTVAGGRSDVRIRFYYRGNYYGWMVDDITLADAKPDMVIETPYYNFGNPKSPNSFTGVYKMLPKSQVLDTMRLGAAIFNNGPANETSEQLNGSILQGATVISQSTTTAKTIKALNYGSLQSDARDTQYVFVAGPKDTGSYVMNVKTLQSADSNLTNNTASLSYKIDNFVVGRDNGIASSSISTSDYTGANLDGFEILNLYEFVQPVTATGASVFLIAPTKPTQTYTSKGSTFDVRLYEFDPQTGKEGALVGQSSIYTITDSTKLNSFVPIKFSAPVALTAKPYWLSIYHYAQATGNGVIVGDDGITPQPGLVTEIAISGTQYNNGNAAMLRLLLDGYQFPNYTGIAQNKTNNLFKLQQNQPNPFNGLTTIGYTLAGAAKVTVDICDVTGKIIMQLNEGNKTAGDYTITLDGNKLGKGVYFYTLRAGDYKETLRMVVAQ